MKQFNRQMPPGSLKKIIGIMLFIFISHSLIAQNTIKGKVSSKEGESLPGVNILVKGTGNGAVTNIDGEYELVASPNNVLVFSFIGFETQEVAVNNQSTINITLLENDSDLKEFVVTALGIERDKEALGYSVSELDGKEFTQARETNIANGLAGKVAGVNVSNIASGPGGSSRVIIRGNTSLTQNNQPLYVIDGIPIDNSNQGSAGMWGGRDQGDGIGNINPDDIETMTVLKGNTAAALYGSRASNGVILITTKSGSSKQGLLLEINSNFVVDKAINRLDTQQEYGHGLNGLKPTTLNEAIAGGDTAWGGKLDGTPVMQFDGVERPYSYSGDNFDRFYDVGHTFTNSIALSGGTEKMGFRFSASDLDNKGIIPNSGLERNNFTMNAQGKVNEKLTFNASGSYIIQTVKNPPAQGDLVSNVNYTVWSLAPSINVLDLQGDPDRLGARPENGSEFLPAQTVYFENPYFSAYQKSNKSERTRLLGSFALSYDFTDWLFLKGRTGIDQWNRSNENIMPSGSAQQPLGSMQQSQTKHKEINSDVMLGSKMSFKNGIEYNALIGAATMTQERYGNSTNGNDFAIPFFYNYSNTIRRSGGTSYYTKGINSVYGLAEVSYKAALFLTATGRKDWFSTLNGRGIFYPSISTSAVLSELMEMPSFMDYFKLRLAWAQVGGDTSPYVLNQTYSLGQPHYGNPQGGIAQDFVANSGLNPLLATEFELGFNAQFAKNRIGLDFTVYQRTTKDDILPATISQTSGYNSAQVNVGEVSNKGIELLLTIQAIQQANFTWNASFNLGYNKSEVVSLIDPDIDGERLQLDQNRTQNAYVENIEGLPYGQVTGYQYLRDASGNIVVNSSGLPMRDDEAGIVPFGSGVHPLTGGITNSFSYKNFSLGFLVDYKFGGVIFSGTNSWLYRRGMHKNTLVGREDGIGDVPAGQISAYYNEIRNKIAEQFVYDADFVKLREINIGYAIPTSFLSRIKVQEARISLVGRNLLLLHSKVENIDPESTYNEGNAQGMDFFQTPQTRSYGVNLNIKF
ncbi:SusC/RagA family TonB-linked outer membrane protein [Algoriphagus chordae]|uniref:TonB-linked SusC/RagA family outer membrane protein n=1 Tax=Algoriphagus chordae TaxID=237019 RepID=A0A2W7STG4_9BACT|nr:SusC/RagA family TonB-linked outer membrane protein [Algoriphagus chordae]PZX54002.1 TonB-linked SusC/RagA family outer membrane protein [Algoriphagus chordae]